MGRPQKSVYAANATALGDLANPLRDAADKMLESSDRVRNTVYDFEWEGEAKDAAEGRVDRELVQDRAVGAADYALADAYDNGAKTMQPMIDSLKSKGQGLEADDFAVSEDWVVTDTYNYVVARKLAPLFGLSTSDVDAIQTQRANTATTETVNLQRLADELGVADENTTKAINDAKAALADAIGVAVGGQSNSPLDPNSERVRNQKEAFKKVYGRDPVSANDWRMAAALDPHSYDPRNQGVPPQVQVVRIRPVPGQGLVRASQWIPQRDVLSGPGKRDFGNDRGADPHFDPANTKVTTYIDYDNGVVVMRQNPSVEQTANGGPGQVKVGIPQGSVTQTPDGAVRIRYNAANPFAPEIAKNPPFPLTDHPWTVNGDLVFTPGANGVHVDGTRGDYPSMEVYQDLPNGTTNTVIIDPARTGNSYGPIENLPFHHDVGIGGKAFEPFDKGGGWNPKYDVRVPLPPTDFGSPSSPPSVPPLPPTVGTPA